MATKNKELGKFIQVQKKNIFLFYYNNAENFDKTTKLDTLHFFYSFFYFVCGF